MNQPQYIKKKYEEKGGFAAYRAEHDAWFEETKKKIEEENKKKEEEAKS